ncbi:hypothetical protein [Erysipelothrix anatis]|uniref:hypothetical protein n=1 Tax=Erysipelothrix anatis TaxID=2683713 RepID=UPI001358E33F|nr:hypothetical protein [Erysipelothrix anatis]
MNKANDIISKVVYILLEDNWEYETINGVQFYRKNDSFIKFSYSEGLNSIVLENAETIEEAESNIFEDSELYSISYSKEKIVEKIVKDINLDYI